MPSIVDDDWSDSDDEIGAEVETAVLLGVPDGIMETETDIKDAAVSRIGGHPAILPSREPPFSSSQCKICSYPMELLVQVWCPVEDSPMDRALYIWGCSRSACQRKDGSVRAWRALRYNAEYAAKLAKKLAKKQAQQKASSSVKTAPATNPFAMQAKSTPGPFGLGDHVFGQPAPTVAAPAIEDEPEDTCDTESVTSDSSAHSLIIAMASTTIDDSPWQAAPSFPPLYLSTTSEYLPPPPKTKISQSAHIEDPTDEYPKDGKDVSWAFEPYENSLEVDGVFDRFTKRVSHTGEQCLRYELKGIPLPFSSDKVFDRLFPFPPQDPLPVTKAAFKVVPTVRRSYSTTSIPPCPACKAARVFECQLMPNLINVLRASIKDEDTQKLTDEQRMKVVQEVLQKKVSSDKRGMEWGTCMIFSCEKDCCVDDYSGDKECWREELVLVQWDD
ncbi:programmed cell death protein 2 [Suillus discolor]|uniref:Programmed cell death protein 2 n=1 Tax=Suillus discolor TaxID=1912936 RepID=A0A9P7FDF8_9AGAM|nr:programmed cell death protein 2 [Suillus discolor]KAG2113212.1 programmed cell death protein 2 [Suillus discolor]